MASAFRLGFMTHLEGTGDPCRIYEETLELSVAAEQLGFDVAWVAQHHFKDRSGRLPAPFPFWASRRSARAPASWDGACDSAPGRATSAPPRMPLSSIPSAKAVSSWALAAAATLMNSMPLRSCPRYTTRLHLDGQAVARRTMRRCRGRARPAPPAAGAHPRRQALAKRRQCAGRQFCGRYGCWPFPLARGAFNAGQATDELLLPVVEAYLDAWHGRTAASRIGLSWGIYPAADRRTALAALSADVLRHVDGLIAEGQLPAGQSLEQYCVWLNIAYGHPDEVAAASCADRVLPYATDPILQFNPAMPPLSLAIRMLEQIATEIAPQLTMAAWRAGDYAIIGEAV